MKNIIEVKNLSKTYEVYKKQAGMFGSLKNFVKRETILKEAVKDVPFEIKEGEFVGFIGPNGAGKTTTLKMLSVILYPSSGEASALGYTPWDRNPEYQKQFGIVMGQKISFGGIFRRWKLLYCIKKFMRFLMLILKKE